MTNEQIYADMVENRISLDQGIETLVQHLRPIVINASRGFLRVLSWTWDDALQEARILLWELVEKRRFRPTEGKRGFHNFFARCFSNRLNKLYRDTLLRNPIIIGSHKVGYAAHEEVRVGVVAFDEAYITTYKSAQAERNRRLYDKRLAAEGRARQPRLSEEEREARRAAAKERARERALAWQRANREAYNARRAEIRREKKAGTFMDRRKKVAACL